MQVDMNKVVMKILQGSVVTQTQTELGGLTIYFLLCILCAKNMKMGRHWTKLLHQ